jgi:hypothetical protein
MVMLVVKSPFTGHFRGLTFVPQLSTSPWGKTPRAKVGQGKTGKRLKIYDLVERTHE